MPSDMLEAAFLLGIPLPSSTGQALKLSASGTFRPCLGTRMTCQAFLSKEADRSLQVGVCIYYSIYNVFQHLTAGSFLPESCTLTIK